MIISYSILANAVNYYKDKGYTQIEVPWWVSEPILKLTKPKDIDREDYFLSVNNKMLVASGEQSFLYMMAKGMLPDGKYLTVTPCFRNEVQDTLHRKHFIKCELIIAGSNEAEDLDSMIKDSLAFFGTYLPKGLMIIPYPPNDSISKRTKDIQLLLDNHDPVELGSYGMRRVEYFKWIFGTGVAEPRLSMAMALLESDR